LQLRIQILTSTVLGDLSDHVGEAQLPQDAFDHVVGDGLVCELVVFFDLLELFWFQGFDLDFQFVALRKCLRDKVTVPYLALIC
jgi:hypothetical protein